MIPEFLKKVNSEIIAQDGEPYLIKVELLSFEEWPAKVKLQIHAKLEADKPAQVALDILGVTDEQQRIKKFAYCRNGGFDNRADFTDQGEHNAEYFDCPDRATCQAKVQKMLCRCFPAANGILTPREIELIKLICADLSDKLIADQLGIAFDTAKNHRRNIEQKIGCYSKSGVVRFAYENGIA
jgi:DNA-binding CsgD family transcriptional regulator